MKFINVPCLALVALALPGMATEEPSVDSAVLVPEEGHEDRHDIFSRLRVGFHGIRRRPNQRDLAFIIEALKRAYNKVHEPLDDDYTFFDYNCTAIEMEKEKNEASTFLDLFEDLKEDAVDNDSAHGLQYWYSRYRYNLYGIGDVSCRFCGGRRLSALALTSSDQTSDATVSGVESSEPPFAKLKPVEDLLCKILKKKGSKKVFRGVHGCSIFQIEPLGNWNFPTEDYADGPASSASSATIGEESAISIVLNGLACEDNPDICHEKGMRQLLSDALVIAYNEVNFGTDYSIQGFTPTSFELYRLQGGESDELTSALRGGIDMENPHPVGHWRGHVHVQCRHCDNIGASGEDIGITAFSELKQVEALFCRLISGHSDILSNLKECSLSIVQDFSSDVFDALTPEED